VASANAYFQRQLLSYKVLNVLTNHATPVMFCDYKLALQLFKSSVIAIAVIVIYDTSFQLNHNISLKNKCYWTWLMSALFFI
jgi:hypothetical protein